MNKLKQLAFLSIGGSITFTGLCIYNNNEKFYSEFLFPKIHYLIDAETAHHYALWATKYRLFPKVDSINDPLLKTEIFNIKFGNPVGLAAGFDKNGEGILGLSDYGFSFIEIGTVTPQPQPGNQQPRVFRLVEDKGVINRYGFNNDGHQMVLERLVAAKKKQSTLIIGVNLGKNKNSCDGTGDYVKGVLNFGEIADYLVINISSPNTPGLRSLQLKENLDSLAQSIMKERNTLSKKTPVLLKIAPDLSMKEKKDIANVVLKYSIDGLIVSNTTISRPSSLMSSLKNETGGLSGVPLKDLSTQTIRDMYLLTKGTVPIIGVGGISSGQDAFEKIVAGASLVQLYSALVYTGPPIVSKVNRELLNLLREHQCTSIKEAVGNSKYTAKSL